MIGTVIYSTDRETRQALRSMVGSGVTDNGYGHTNIPEVELSRLE